MEEQNNQNFEEQKIKKTKVEENIEALPTPTTPKKPFPKMVIGIVAVAVVAVAVLLIILIGGNKGGNITCEYCGASISEDVKFCSSCGNQATIPPSSSCVHDWEWESATVTCSKDGYNVYKCLKCGGTKQENESAYGCYDYDGDGYCNDCNSYIGITTSAEWISNRSISYQDDVNAYRFCFALKDAAETYIACNATIEMSIVNDLGETIYQGTKYVKTSDYGEWYNIYDKWLGTAVYIYDSEITAGLSDEGTFYYKVITDDNWFEYSLNIYDLPTYTPKFKLGETWKVDGQWEFIIDSVELHYACQEPGMYNNNDLAQYVIITYSYKNLGYSTYKLDFNFTNFDIYDETGELAEYYMCIKHRKEDAYIDIGGKCSGAQVVFGLYNSSDTIRISIEQDDAKAEYTVAPKECAHNIVVDKGYAATCIKTGLSDGSHCSKCEKVITEQKELPLSQTNHSYSDSTHNCYWCGEKDPSYKTPDLILGEYVESHGTKQSDGTYVISWEGGTETMTTMTQIIWNPTEKSLIFAQVSATSISVTTAGIIYEHGASKQKITVINDQTFTGYSQYKITGIGYIYPSTYTISNNNIYSYQCDASSTSMQSANKSLAESSITVLVAEIDRWLERNTDFDISDFGFTSW